MSSYVGTEPLDAHDLIAIVISVFIPGVGHIFLCLKAKGLLILAAVVISLGVGYVLSCIIAVDALLVARTRKFRPVADFECFPEHQRFLGI